METNILSFKLNIATVEKEICSVNVIKLVALGIDGEFQVMRNHAPFLTKLMPGYIYFMDADKKNYDGFILSGGLIEVQPRQVFIFADSAIRSADIDYKKAKKEELEMLNKLVLIKRESFDKKNYSAMKTDLLLASAKLILLKKLKKIY